MTSFCKPSPGLRAALPVVFLLASSPLGRTQAPPPPPPGDPVQIPEKSDPSVTVPQFEVISVKPSKDNQTRVQFTPDGMRGTSVTTRFLLQEGFGGVHGNQLIGEPSWSQEEGFDIEAKVASADLPAMAKLTFEQRASMFQQILADRFKLVVHHETRLLPVYELVIGKNGPRLKKAAPEDPASATPRRNYMMFSRGEILATDTSLATFLKGLSRQLDRILVDKTGLTGKYDLTLKWTSEGAAAPPAGGSSANGASPEPSAPDLFTAIQEQLGLKLVAAKAPIDVVVIDRIEKPSAN